jgi:hypothetical protein
MNPDRDRNGKFIEGNAGGPGRPPRATEREYLLALSESCSPADWEEIVVKAVDDAKDGDAKARPWLAGYLVCQPGSRGEMLHTLAVEVAAGSDPLRLDAARRRNDDARSELMHQSLAWTD